MPARPGISGLVGLGPRGARLIPLTSQPQALGCPEPVGRTVDLFLTEGVSEGLFQQARGVVGGDVGLTGCWWGRKLGL